MKKKAVWTGCIITLGFAAICAADQTVEVIDMVGRQVASPFDPERIVCIGPGALRLIVYLQAQAKVVGVEDMEKRHPGGRPYWIAHPELRQLPRCGPGGPAGINKKPDLEAVLSVKPQMLFATYMDRPLADEVQRTLGIPVVVLSYGAFASFDETVYDALRIAGRILNRDNRADDIVTYLEFLRKDLHDRTASIPENSKPEVYVSGIGYRGAHGIESTEQRYIPFDWVHAKNLAEKVKASMGSHVVVNKETLLKLNPEIVFIDAGGVVLVVEEYRKNPKYYNSLQAFSNRRVYTLLPFNLYTTNIGTALADAYAIGKILYEECFEDVDPEKRADEIYTFLVGKPVYQKMKTDYGPIGQMATFLD